MDEEGLAIGLGCLGRYCYSLQFFLFLVLLRLCYGLAFGRAVGARAQYFAGAYSQKTRVVRTFAAAETEYFSPSFPRTHDIYIMEVGIGRRNSD